MTAFQEYWITLKSKVDTLLNAIRNRALRFRGLRKAYPRPSSGH